MLWTELDQLPSDEMAFHHSLTNPRTGASAELLTDDNNIYVSINDRLFKVCLSDLTNDCMKQVESERMLPQPASPLSLMDAELDDLAGYEPLHTPDQAEEQSRLLKAALFYAASRMSDGMAPGSELFEDFDTVLAYETLTDMAKREGFELPEAAREPGVDARSVWPYDA